jgi:hypothetical protein
MNFSEFCRLRRCHDDFYSQRKPSYPLAYEGSTSEGDLHGTKTILHLGPAGFNKDCEEGYKLEQNGTCTQCPAGTYTQDNRRCIDCFAGTYSSAGALYCTPCPHGMTSDPGSAACYNCTAGTFQNVSRGSGVSSRATQHCVCRTAMLSGSGTLQGPVSVHCTMASVLQAYAR